MEQTLVPPAEQTKELPEPSQAPFAQDETSPLTAASSPEAHALRVEIITVGRKLWESQCLVPILRGGYLRFDGDPRFASAAAEYTLGYSRLLSPGGIRNQRLIR